MQQPVTHDSVELRLGRLEHELAQATRAQRRYRFGLTATLGCVGVLALLAATDITRIDAIRTHRLEILDDQGRVMLAAGTDAAGGRLDLWSSSGANLMRLGSNEHGGDLALWSHAGVNVAGAWATDSGGSMAAWNTAGNRAATMAAVQDGGVLTLNGDSNAQSVLTGAAFTLRGAQGVGDMSLQLAAGGGDLQCGSTTLRVRDTGGLTVLQNEHAILQASAMDGETSLTLAAPDGTATMRAGADAGLDLLGLTATLHLAGGETESVTIASDPDAAIIKTSDEALSLYASHGAGRMVLGSGEGGQVRITGGVDGLAAAVDVLAPGSTRMATLSTTKSGLGLLAVCDTAGTPVGLLHGAATGRGRLSVHGPGGIAVAATAADGTPEFALMTTDGNTTAALAATVRGGALNLMNADGTPVVLAGITSNGPGGAAAFQNGAGKTVVAVGSTKDNVGRVVVD